MTHKFTKFNNDDRAFSGLEAAIVLIAFVVVAAAFSFAVLNAGFYATQEATGAIHTGLAEATSALKLGGEVIADANVSAGNVTFIHVPVMLAAGGRPIDLTRNRTIVTYVDVDNATVNLHDGNNTNITWTLRHDVGRMDDILEFGEIATLRINISLISLPHPAMPLNLTANEQFTINIQPAQGSGLSIDRRIPAFIDSRMILRTN